MWYYVPAIVLGVIALAVLVVALVWRRRMKRALLSDAAQLKEIWKTKVEPRLKRKPSPLERAVESMNDALPFGGTSRLIEYDKYHGCDIGTRLVLHNEWAEKINLRSPLDRKLLRYRSGRFFANHSNAKKGSNDA